MGYTMPKLDPINTEKYSAPPPPLNMRKNVEAWKEAIINAETQLEHQTLRIENLELMNSHLSKAWIAYSNQLKTHKKQLQHLIEECKAETAATNRERKESQVEVKSKLDKLEKQWFQLIRKNQ